MKKALRQTQTLRTGRAKNYRPATNPFPSAGEGLHLQTQFGEDRCT